jgi:flagellar biosynthesis protein FliQ
MEIGINQRACLVLKVFHTQSVFESELRAYLALQEAGVTFIPQLLGVFKIPGTKGALLLTMVGQAAKEPFDFHDR